MAVTQVFGLANPSTGSENTISITFPSTPSDGDTLFLQVSVENTSVTPPSTPSGWTAVGTNPQSAGNLRHYVWSRTWSTGDPTSVTISKNTYTFMTWSIACFTNVYSWSAVRSTASASSIIAASAASTDGGMHLLLTGARANYQGGYATLTSPSGYTAYGNAAVQDSSVLMSIKALTGSSTAAATVTANKSVGLGLASIVMAPAADPVAPTGATVKVNTGSAWITLTDKTYYWDGAAWQPAVVKFYNGSQWVTSGGTSSGGGGDGGGDGGGGTTNPPSPNPSGVWYSGMSGREANGTNRDGNGPAIIWRGDPAGITQYWPNGNAAMVAYWNLDPADPARELDNWVGPIDLAIGGIERSQGETWAKAAAGAYDARWTQSANKLKSLWTDRGGGRLNSMLYIRFAHEHNGGWFEWSVARGEEAAFKNAWRRWYNIWQAILPGFHPVWSPNKDSHYDDGWAKAIDCVPPLECVHVIGPDIYNGYPAWTTTAQVAAWFTSYQNGEPLGPEAWRLYALSLGKPFACPEWSNTAPNSGASNGNESPAYVNYWNAWLRQNAGTGPGQVVYEILFNQWKEYQFYGSLAHQPATAAAYQACVWGR